MLFASPMDETVTSIVSPSRVNGGSVAVTMTAATLSGFRLDVSIETPNALSMLPMLCTVSLTLFESPVFARPTTRP